jgi:hypothetical protein
MTIRTIAAYACLLTLVLIRSAAGQDAAAQHDYPGLGRVEGYKLTRYEEKRFDKVTFDLPDHAMTIEGHVMNFHYEPDGTEPSASALEINRSFRGVLQSLGGEVLRYPETDGPGICGRFTRNGGNVFANVYVSGNGSSYNLGVVEERVFRPLVKQPDTPTKP